jgi:hypothetical protein
MCECYSYDPADWRKRDRDCEPKEEVEHLTETKKKIAHYERQSRRHWHSWKTYGSRVYLYHYKQANRKIRQLQEQALNDV